VVEEITCIKAGGKRAGGNVPMRVAGCMENLSHLPVMELERNHHGYRDYLIVSEHLSKCAIAQMRESLV
jgi:hypothetical protein